ncbi:MAG: indolepyruvate ferredoxin oxidoreductase subunit alpha [Alphaproteobacteria bacterium]|jgi:indolepyruvate ferredoxin oxidoreductase alpha subunit|nr:indolepyruvate ferredoxin oxidoreductase subunit alpha [Alphaproteobacteria bacterium]MDP6256345.1 indolepyruvate ferredoxin oxidoreductase subunit alpha [Alphaproteobacteria bacterium]MDP7053050.1 indolepyruvate ferredoxin oxidoreductase subunit alpha [Alphaproteobacteria bacterium]MDP7230863.1 indolepyruvate ferredoxin oxidoreductase subunit alpha [Alphaproteobacteria bacterium]MDP7460234.1 indolepyruvate ferredoxin oxidoreductase subunit alpha [Alphaproteobacteria bacterium]|tara:strand:- start:3563 stop:5692 length:2130 start_codon:yes stop_codon:yes gene_type:complete
MERSFAKEVKQLRLGQGETFHGEGILAVTKALLQSGVSYVGGYQGAPISHLMDVLVDAEDLLSELGVHLETSTSEAAAAAMLGASINYPLRGAVTWKSTVGTNVASDALSNLASAGVTGGAIIVLGEDYGEGSSILQERTHAFATKSQIWLLDPRPDLETIVHMVEQGFELSEYSSTPVMLELRIRACHVHGAFPASDNKVGQFNRNRVIKEPNHDFARITLPPSTYAQEKHKVEVRMPEAINFIRERRLNDYFAGDINDVGLICQGGLYNATLRALVQAGLADAAGNSRIPILALNVTYPLVPDEISDFCAGKSAIFMIEEGQPDYLEEAINVILRKADLQTTVIGKGPLPMAGEYTAEVVLRGLSAFLDQTKPAGIDLAAATAPIRELDQYKAKAAELLGDLVPTRPPTFCTGCPERPLFSAIRILEKDLGPTHVSCDIGCHTFSTLPPFNLGHTVLGYGLGLSSAAAVAPNFGKRVISIMGDGGFWHNGVTNGVSSALFNKADGVLMVIKNGYTSATGWQFVPSTLRGQVGRITGVSIENVIKSLGANWLRKVPNYRVGRVMKTLRMALTGQGKGLRVIVADSECQLARQRRIRPEIAARLQSGQRDIRTRFGVDDETCTGDRACIRLSGCPSLTIKANPDPLRDDPVTTVLDSCLGCGLCGEVAHAAVLCPSFYKAEIVRNPNPWDRFRDSLNRYLLGDISKVRI